MKSPLKFLAGLMGRSRVAAPPQALIGQDPEPKLQTEARERLEASVSALALPSAADATLHQSAEQSSTLEPPEDEAILDADASDSLQAVDETVTPTDNGVAPWPDDAAVALAGESRLISPAKTRAKRISQEKTALKIEAAVGVNSTDDDEVAPTTISASNEAISLDDEITALRKQLAQKLHLQNSQLKKMLERFERF